MSYLDKQIQTILEFEPVIATAAAGATLIGGAFLPKLTLKYDCTKETFKQYEDAIQLELKKGNMSKVERLKSALERQKKECKNLKGETYATISRN